MVAPTAMKKTPLRAHASARMQRPRDRARGAPHMTMTMILAKRMPAHSVVFSTVICAALTTLALLAHGGTREPCDYMVKKLVSV